MLMTGANCYSQDYSFLEQQLAGKGYLVAVIDELHPVTPDTQAFISCKQGYYMLLSLGFAQQHHPCLSLLQAIDGEYALSVHCATCHNEAHCILRPLDHDILHTTYK